MYETYKDRDGVIRNVHHLGKDGQERMARNGWRLRVADKCNESAQEMYDRLSAHYSDVRIYWTGTMIPGIHSRYAECKK